MKAIISHMVYQSGAPSGCVRLNVDIAIPRTDLDAAVAVLIQRALAGEAAPEPAVAPAATPVAPPKPEPRVVCVRADTPVAVPTPEPAHVDWHESVVAVGNVAAPPKKPKGRGNPHGNPHLVRAESAGSTLPDAQVRKAIVAAHRGGKDALALMRTPWRMADGRLLRFKRPVIDEVLREAGGNPTFASVLRDVVEAPPQEPEPTPEPTPAPATTGARPARKPIALTKDALTRIKERLDRGVPLAELAREAWPTTWGEARVFSAGRLEELVAEAALCE